MPPQPGAFDGCSNLADAANVTPTIACVATWAGRSYALFGHSSSSSTTVFIAPNGPANHLSPGPAGWTGIGTTQPPGSFRPGTHAATFIVPYSGGLTWTLGTKSVTTIGAPTCSTHVDGEKIVADLPGGASSVVLHEDPRPALGGGLVRTQTPLANNVAIGEVPGSFGVNDDGAATFTLPLVVPDGRAGMQPRLAFEYDSRQGNGLLGVGWRLAGLSQIERCPRNFHLDGETFPISFTEDDRLCLDGVPLVWHDGRKELRPQNDPFVRITVEARDALGPTGFTVETRDGRIHHYGRGDARLEARRLRNTCAGPGDGPLARLAWLIDESRDRSGNSVRYAYETITSPTTQTCAHTGACSAVEKRPREITYTHHSSGLAATRTVQFQYDDARPDRELTFIGARADFFGENCGGNVVDVAPGGVALWLASRLSRVRMVVSPLAVASPDQQLAREYRLSYELGKVSGRSLLTGVTECDYAGACKPTRRFRYESGAPLAGEPVFSLRNDLHDVARPQFFSGTGPKEQPRTNVVVADFDGDGRDDILYFSTSHSWVLRRGTPLGVGPATVLSLPIFDSKKGAENLGPMPIAVDWDSDGRVDLAWPVLDKSKVDRWHYDLYRWSSGAFVFAGKSWPDTKRSMHFGDFDGDGRTDATWLAPDDLHFTAELQGRPYAKSVKVLADAAKPLFVANVPGVAAAWVAPSLVAGYDAQWFGVDETVFGAKTPKNHRWNLPLGLSNAHTFLDVNGDGLADAFEQVPGKNLYALVLNAGGVFRVAGFSSFLLSDWGPQENRGILAVDLRQRGRPDLVVVAGDGAKGTAIRYDIAGPGAELVGNASPESSLPFFKAADAEERWHLAQSHVLDANGDGLDDLLVPERPETQHGINLRLYVRNAKKADHLVEVGNGLGDVTRVHYRPLEQIAAATGTEGCNYPVQCAFRGMWVVDRYELHAQDPTITRSFKLGFEGPAADVRGGGFLGFGARTIKDEQIGSETRITFGRYKEKWEGAYPFARVATSIHSRVPATPTQIVETTNTLRFRLLVTPPTSGSPIPTLSKSELAVVAVPIGLVQRVVEQRGATTEMLRDTEATLEYDAWGNVTLHQSIAKRTGVRRVTRAAFRNDPVRWLLGVLEREEDRSEAGFLAVISPERGIAVRTTAYESDVETGLLKKVIVEPEGGADLRLETLLSRDAFGQVVTAVERDTVGQRRQWDVAWDPLDAVHPIATVDPGGRLRRFVHHSALGVLLELRDERANAHRWQYDGFGRLRTVLPPKCVTGSCPVLDDEITITHEAGAASGVVFAVRAIAKGRPSTLHGFDPLGRVVQVERAAFSGTAVKTVGYDRRFPALASQLFEAMSTSGGGLGGFVVSGATYDGLGRPLTTTSPAHGTIRHVYEGLKARTIDAGGRIHELVQDEIGRVVQSVEVEGFSGSVRQDVVTRYFYGAFDTLVRVEDAQRNSTDVFYDARGRRTRIVDPDTGETRIEHDAFGLARRMVDALGRETLVAYDSLDRPIARKTSDALSCFAYGASGGSAGSLIASVHTPTSGDIVSQHLEYDGYGRQSAVHQRIGSSDALTLRTTYDLRGRIDALTYPNGFVLKHRYTEAGYLQGLETAAGAPIWTELRQNLLGQTEAESFGNGLGTVRTYDPKTTLPRSIATFSFASVGAKQRLHYTWRPDGNLATRTDSTDAASPSTESFGYDGIGRLESWTYARGGLSWSTRYAYDAIGNLLDRSVTPPSGAPKTESFLPGPSGPRVGGVVVPGGEEPKPPHAVMKSSEGTYDYDATGDQVVAPGRKTTWTTFHLPKTIETAEGTTTFAYDAAGTRVRKTAASGETTTYAFGLFERYEKGGAVVDVCSIGNGSRVVAQLVRSRGGADTNLPAERFVYVHDDHLGSAHVLTGPSQEVLEHRVYEPFGRRIDPADPLKNGAVHAGARLGFTGHEPDDDLGLVNMRGRVYDPKVARFLSADPFVQSPFEGKSLNRYSYVFNNPINFVDPSGFTARFIDTINGPIWIDSSSSWSGSPVPGGGGSGGGAVPDCTASKNCHGSQHWKPPTGPPPKEPLNILPTSDSTTARGFKAWTKVPTQVLQPGGAIDVGYDESLVRWLIVDGVPFAEKLGTTSFIVLSLATGALELEVVASEAIVLGRLALQGVSGAWRVVSGFGTRLLPAIGRGLVGFAAKLGLDGSRTSQRGAVNLAVITGKKHGNSLQSTSPQHVYEITRIDQSGNIELFKFGISGAPLTSDGRSPRAEAQVKALNWLQPQFTHEASVVMIIPGGHGARMQALTAERSLVYQYKALDGAKPPGNKRP